MESEQLEHRLEQLDEQNLLFPQFTFTKENGRLRLIGTGGFSQVYEMCSREHPALRFALKVMGADGRTVNSTEFANAVRLQRTLSHDSQYVVSVLAQKELKLSEHNAMVVNGASKEAWEETDDCCRVQLLLMEELEPLIVKNRFQKVALVRDELRQTDGIMKLALEIGQAVTAMHGRNILHRDIKLENIFWNEHAQVYQLGDFGASKYTQNGSAETVIYSDGYRAPEIERSVDTCYGAAADIYSFGITLYLLFNDMKFPGAEGYIPKLEVQYNPNWAFPPTAHASAQMNRIIRKMCSYYPQNRYRNMADVLEDLTAVCRSETRVPKELPDTADHATQTYRANQPEQGDDRQDAQPRKTIDDSFKEQKQKNRRYALANMGYLGALTVSILLMLQDFASGDQFLLDQKLWWLVPPMVVIEAFWLKIEEFQRSFWAITVGVLFLSAHKYGSITILHIVLLAALLTGTPVLTAAGGLAVGLWSIGEWRNKSIFFYKICAFIYWHHLGWLMLAVVLIVIFKYLVHEGRKNNDDRQMDAGRH